MFGLNPAQYCLCAVLIQRSIARGGRTVGSSFLVAYVVAATTAAEHDRVKRDIKIRNFAAGQIKITVLGTGA